MDIYQQQGYDNRAEYLSHLADELGIDLETVEALAEALGPSEDFYGLVSVLQDY